MNDLSKARAKTLEVGEEAAAQRVDNFLFRHLKGVPKSHVYRVLRSGEVRVNSGRVKPEYRLQAGDRVRHRRFAEGIVVSSQWVKGDEEVTVAFVGQGVKRLIAAYAGLERA